MVYFVYDMVIQDEGIKEDMKEMFNEDKSIFSDMVPVVRCKDCKYWLRDDPAGNGCECRCNGGWWLPEDYCSCGERIEVQKNV